MDMDLSASDDARRHAVRSWLTEHPTPTRAQLGESGYLTPHWPAPWGLDADPEHQLIIDDELHRAESGSVDTFFEASTIGLGWAGPTILAGGSPEQQERWLPGILDGSETWTQLFSEPESGSDLASLRIRAQRDGDAYVITGQKVWSTWADTADWGILLARTGDLAEKQRGISYFCVDMSLPGIEVRPIIEMTGGNHFNETWFDEVRVPLDCLIGDEGDGWRLAKVTLGAERLSLSEGGVLWGMGPTAEQCFEHLRGTGSWDDPVDRQRFASLWTDAEIIRLLSLRMLSSAVAGSDPSSFASIRKCLADVFGQDVLSLVKDRRGAAGMLGTQDFESEHDDVYHWGYLFSRALTIGGGTSEVQRNIIGERLLGLPREPTPAIPPRHPAHDTIPPTDPTGSEPMTNTDLYETMSTLRAVRKLRPDPIPDEVLERVLQAACWAPTGGNMQPWRVVVVTDPEVKQGLADIYGPEWEKYSAGFMKRIEGLPAEDYAKWERIMVAGNHLSDHLAEAPAILMFCANPKMMAITDAQLDQVSIVGGGSVYPAVQNLMLACVAEGLGCALTTLHCLREGEVMELLGIPDGWATAAMVPIGYPVGKGHGPITRLPPTDMAYRNAFGTAWGTPE